MKKRDNKEKVKQNTEKFLEAERNGWKRSIKFDYMKQTLPWYMLGSMCVIDSLYTYSNQLGFEYRINLTKFDFPELGEVVYASFYKKRVSAQIDFGEIISLEEKRWLLSTFFKGEYYAIEMYPDESQLIDEVNLYHMWFLRNEQKVLPFSIDVIEDTTEQTSKGKFVHKILPDSLTWGEKQCIKNANIGFDGCALEVIKAGEKDSHMVFLPKDSELPEMFNIIGKTVFDF